MNKYICRISLYSLITLLVAVSFLAGFSTVFQSQAEAQEPLIGYVGCSMTLNGVNGYFAVNGTKFWAKPLASYGGGSLYAWARNTTNNNPYWAAFQAKLTENPGTQKIWYQLCANDSEKTNETYLNALKVITEIKARVPGAIVYVSGQPGYTNGHVCTTAGASGPARMKGLADKLVADGRALAGPVVGPLTYPTQTVDTCHANNIGESFLGNQIRTFFN